MFDLPHRLRPFPARLRAHRWAIACCLLVGILVVAALLIHGSAAAAAATPSTLRPTARHASFHGPVSARPSCIGHGCDYTDTFATGCAGGSASYTLLASAPILTAHGVSVGTVELWRSWTCNTKWSQVNTVSPVHLLTASLVDSAVYGSRLGMRSCACSRVRSGQYYLPATPAAGAGTLANFTTSGTGQTQFA